MDRALLHKHEGLNSNPQNPCRSQTQEHSVYNPSTHEEIGGRNRRSPGAYRPASLVYEQKYNKETLSKMKGED